MSLFSNNEAGVGDFILLPDPIDEKSFIENMKIRFEKGYYYTYIGEASITYLHSNIYN